MRDIIEGDFLYIDCGTVACGFLEGATDCKGGVSIVLNRHKNAINLAEIITASCNALPLRAVLAY